MIVKRLLGILITGALVAGGAANAQEQFNLNGELNSLHNGLAKPSLMLEQDFLYADSVGTAGLKGLSLKVINSEGRMVYKKSSAGEPLSVFISDLSLPNGDYRYEVTAIYTAHESLSIIPGFKASSRDYGVFTIKDGLIEDRTEEQLQDGDDQAFVEPATGENSFWMAGLAWVADFLVGSAQAASLSTAPDGDVFVEDDSPSIFLSYGADTGINDGTAVWGLLSYINGTTDADFTIRGYSGGSRDVMTIGSGAPASSFDIAPIGDITLAGGSVFIDESISGMHIGSATNPFGSLQLTGASGVLFTLLDDSVGEASILYQSGGEFGVAYGLSSVPFVIENAAPNDALRITAAGTVSSTGSIHLGSTADPVGQFAITEPGIVRFEMIDTASSKRWRFTNAGNKFAINQVDAPGTEFSVFENGNATLAGVLTENSDVNSKQEIVPVDSNDLLARIAELPIAEWSYIDAPKERHIGPMAQDFHAAFGLGKSNKSIATLDSSGVALAGIKALKAENDRITAENQALRTELNEQKARLMALENRQVEIMASLATLTAEGQEPLLVVTSISQ